MTDIANGMNVTGVDTPPSAWAQDDTVQLNQVNTTYSAGTPEVGTTFVAPTSGRVRITVGGGIRDNTGTDRIFMSPQVFKGPNSSGTEILVPSTALHGYSNTGNSTEYGYASRVCMLDSLTPGETYYARVMHLCNTGAGTADMSTREILIVPLS